MGFLMASRWLQHLDEDDWRLLVLLVLFSTIAGVLLESDLDPGYGEVDVLDMPERMLRVVLRPPDAEVPAPHGVEPGRGGVPGRTSNGRSETTVPSDPLAQWRDNPFSHPVFGIPDPTADLLADALDGQTAPEREGTSMDWGSGDLGRTDALLGQEPARMPEVVVAWTDVREAAPVARAGVTALAVGPPIVSAADQRAALKAWQRHALACHRQTLPLWTGRLVLHLTVAQGRVSAVDVEVDRTAPAVLVDCLAVRARHLLRFSEGVSGKADVPLTFGG